MAAVVHPAGSCPRCGEHNSLPLADGRRECQNCGRVWRPVLADGGEEITVPCAICGDPTPERDKYWGRVVCEECADRPVVFAASCRRDGCHWCEIEADDEYGRGEAKQAIQRACNAHERRERVINDDRTHDAVWWEADLSAGDGEEGGESA